MTAVLPPRSLALTIVEASTCIILNAVSLVGNTMVLFLMHKSPRLRTITNRCITAVAIIDLISASVLMPLTAGTLITGKWNYGDFGCKVHAFTMHFCLYASACTLALTAFNRYVKIVKPNLYRVIFTERLTTVYLASAWSFVIAYVVIPRLAGWTKFKLHPGHAVCLAAYKTEDGRLAHYTIVIGGFVVFPLTLASVCYYKISQTVRRHNLTTASSLENETNRQRISAHEIRISQSLFVVVFFFIISWVPTWIVVALNRYHVVDPMPRNAHLLCTFLFFSSNSINPFIYAGMNKTFRVEFKRLLVCGRGVEVLPDSRSGNRNRKENVPLQNMTNSTGTSAS